MSITHTIEELRREIKGWWDADDSMANDYVLALPQGKLVQAIYDVDPAILFWLTFFVARRTLPCWEISCNDPTPRENVEAIGRYLREGAVLDWADVSKAVSSPYNDCRFSETQSAADAVANCAHYIQTQDPVYAIYCISNGDIAYDHVLVDDRFREWLIDIAIPVALKKREMTVEEQEAMRQNSTTV
jgi:hypothetical protein